MLVDVVEPISSVNAAMANLIDLGIDPTKKGYRTSGFFMADVALNGFDIPITEGEVAHLVLAQGVLRAVDDEVDDRHISMDDLASMIGTVSEGKAVDGFLNASEASLFATILDTMSDDRRQLQLQTYCNWPKFEESKRLADSLGTYVCQTLKESAAYGFLCSAIDTPSTYAEHLKRKKFNRWVSNMLNAGYLIDYAVDMPKDYADGRCNIKPTLPARLQILKLAVPESAAATRQVPIRAVPRLYTLLRHYLI